MQEEDFGLVQLSTGDLLRAAEAQGTEAGMKAKAIMDSGRLVPDDVLIAVLADRLAASGLDRGIILDGFPRTAAQAAALDTLLVRRGQRVTAAISLEVDDAAMVGRIAGRYTCAACGEGYHDQFKHPATAGVCDKCGGTAFRRRADDKAETVAERLRDYHAETAPLIAHYGAQGVLRTVDAMASIAAIRHSLSEIVGAVAA